VTRHGGASRRVSAIPAEAARRFGPIAIGSERPIVNSLTIAGIVFLSIGDKNDEGSKP
jgi:hypothetical protein